LVKFDTVWVKIKILHPQKRSISYGYDSNHQLGRRVAVNFIDSGAGQISLLEKNEIVPIGGKKRTKFGKTRWRKATESHWRIRREFRW